MAWLHTHYNSEALRMPVSMEVLLPQQGAGSFNSAPFKTLYLLHDMGEDHTAWLRYSSVERLIDNKNIAVIMPAGHLGFYTDMKYGRNYFKFICEELPVLCERMFPLSAERNDRVICGYGIGGYGAIKAGLLAGNLFADACSINGNTDILKVFDNMPTKNAEDIFDTRDKLEKNINNLNFAAQYAKQHSLNTANILLYCEKGSELSKENAEFHNYLTKNKIPHTFIEGLQENKPDNFNIAVEEILKRLKII